MSDLTNPNILSQLDAELTRCDLLAHLRPNLLTDILQFLKTLFQTVSIV